MPRSRSHSHSHSRSRSRSHFRSHSRSRSPPRQRRRRSRSYEDRDRNQERPPQRARERRNDDLSPPRRREEDRGRRRPPPTTETDDTPWGERRNGGGGDKPQAPKEKPNFKLSGMLAESNLVVNGVTLKWGEPPEARQADKAWRLYVFKGDEAIDTIPIHRMASYLLGKERKVADIPLDHPSCSRQHAVLVFRQVEDSTGEGRVPKMCIKPYIIDLDSANGTLLNGEKIRPARYVELLEKDVLKFGFSTREYVLLHAESASG